MKKKNWRAQGPIGLLWGGCTCLCIVGRRKKSQASSSMVMAEPMAEPMVASDEARDEEEYFCLDCWRVPSEMGITALPNQNNETREAAQALIDREFVHTSKGKFKENSLTERAEISFLEQSAVVATMVTIMGGALWWPFFGMALFALGAWSSVALYVAATLILMYHPMPDVADSIAHWWILRAIYKYFSYRLVYRGANKQALQRSDQPWIGTGGKLLLWLIIPERKLCLRVASDGRASWLSNFFPFFSWLTIFHLNEISASWCHAFLQSSLYSRSSVFCIF